MQEIWKDIKGYEQMYQVSSMGRVRSLDRLVIRCNGANMKLQGAIKKQTMTKKYYVCMLSSKRKRTRAMVHRLVAEAFIGEIGENTVDHISSVRSDNRVQNLQIISRAENIKKSFKDGLHDERIERLAQKKVKKLSLAQANMIRECFFSESNKNAIHKKRPFTLAWLASAFGVSEKVVSGIVNNRTYLDRSDK